MPDRYRSFCDGWRRLHPDWEYRFWSGDNLPPLQNRDLYENADNLCLSLAGQFRSDIVRYELLYQFGGVWVDTDFECLRPIGALLEGVDCFVAWVTGDVINNGIMGATPGHPFIRRLIDGLPASMAAHPGQAPRVISGPQYLTPLFRKYGESDGVVAFDRRLFYPYLWCELQRGGQHFPDAYAVHHWGNRRRERNRPL